MGIPGFNTWFYANNKQAYQTLQQTQTDHLYIDMNSVLHNVLRKAENYDKYHALLHKRLDMILRLTNPRKSVMLAIDGPAPLAKLITQRERRKVLCSRVYSVQVCIVLPCSNKVMMVTLTQQA
eukprot:GHUV01031256.1.p1 GENE.GHUV01031256.1~~GHUV01031256.1.p1  ORF type:complete len:123 (+),score=22.48 GHUV01031256.1:183-551(+)